MTEKTIRTVTIKIEAKSKEQINWAMMILRPMIKDARRDIVEDGLKISMLEGEDE